MEQIPNNKCIDLLKKNNLEFVDQLLREFLGRNNWPAALKQIETVKKRRREQDRIYQQVEKEIKLNYESKPQQEEICSNS